MKKIHSVLYIKFSKVLSNAYDKTGFKLIIPLNSNEKKMVQTVKTTS